MQQLLLLAVPAKFKSNLSFRKFQVFQCLGISSRGLRRRLHKSPSHLHSRDRSTPLCEVSSQVLAVRLRLVRYPAKRCQSFSSETWLKSGHQTQRLARGGEKSEGPRKMIVNKPLLTHLYLRHQLPKLVHDSPEDRQLGPEDRQLVPGHHLHLHDETPAEKNISLF